MPAERARRAGRLARRALLVAWISLCGACLLVLPSRQAPIVIECTTRAVAPRGAGGAADVPVETHGLRRVLRGDGEGFVQALDAAGAVLRTERELSLGQQRLDALHGALLALCRRDHGQDVAGHDENDLDRALRRRVEERVLGERASEQAETVARLELSFDDLRLQAEVPLVDRTLRPGLGAYDRHALSLVDAVLEVFDGAR